MKVITSSGTKLVKNGVVVTVSECGRYAIVLKKYGRKTAWKEPHKVADLEWAGK
jgi:hypothetical protein